MRIDTICCCAPLSSSPPHHQELHRAGSRWTNKRALVVSLSKVNFNFCVLSDKIFGQKIIFQCCTRLGLVKGRRWQWVPNCPISRIVAFVEKVSNLGPNRGDCETAGGTSTRGDSCLSNRLYPPPPPAPAGGACLCRVPKHAATVEKGYLSKKSGTQPESFEPPSQIRPMKKVHWKDERRKGGKLSTSGSLGCRPGQAITIIECSRLSNWHKLTWTLKVGKRLCFIELRACVCVLNCVQLYLNLKGRKETPAPS